MHRYVLLFGNSARSCFPAWNIPSILIFMFGRDIYDATATALLSLVMRRTHHEEFWGCTTVKYTPRLPSGISPPTPTLYRTSVVMSLFINLMGSLVFFSTSAVIPGFQCPAKIHSFLTCQPTLELRAGWTLVQEGWH